MAVAAERLGVPQCRDFIHQKNLEHYCKLLAVTQDEAERKLLLKLLAEEKAKEPPPKMAVNDDGFDRR